MSSFGAVLDTCVLIPARIRDTLLLSAEAGLYRVQWSDDILHELRDNLIQHHLCTQEQAERMVGQMQEHFPEALAEAYKGLIPAMPINQKDRHVLAAAIATSSQAIVTANLRDFPDSLLRPYGIEAQSPDEFLTDLHDLDPGAIIQVLRRQASNLRRPPHNLAWLLDQFAKDTPKFHAAVLKSLEYHGH